jgi:hypothetical protein
MAALPTTYGNLIDIAKSLDPDGTTADVVEMLKKEVPILEVLPFMAGNLETGHRHVIRTGLPEGTWRRLYEYVQPGKSQKVQVDDTCGMLEAFTEVDEKLIELAGAAGPTYRQDEDMAYAVGMGHQVAETIVYGNGNSSPAKFTGLAPRYNSLSAQNADNIIDGGGSGSDNTSVWIIAPGKKKIHGIFPKNTKAGISMKDLGVETKTDSSGGLLRVYRSQIKWDCGIVVADWRYAVRICNIDVSDLKKDAATGADLIDLCVDGIERLPSTEGAMIFCNRKIRSFMRRQMINHKNAHLTLDQVAGKKVMALSELPVYRLDSIVENEARVT